MGTPLIVKHKDEERLSDYRTKCVILETYEEMAEAMRTEILCKSRLNSPFDPSAEEKGNFLPLPEWNPVRSKPGNWPSHTPPPKEVSDA